jgi:hypothetical protein
MLFLDHFTQDSRDLTYRFSRQKLLRFKSIQCRRCKETIVQTNHVEKCCKRVIRIRKSKKDRQYNGQKKQENKRTNNDLQNTTQKTKD